MKASIVIRTYNEARHLPQLLRAIRDQQAPFESEVIVVDSGSNDGTVEIAAAHGCRLVHIEKDRFSFGRSLNIGCEAAAGTHLVFVSGHCIPATASWLRELVEPLGTHGVVYAYGGQYGHDTSKFSECRLFAKCFPEQRRVPQEGFFCNNANAALLKSAWLEERFDEDLTGLEDMHLARKLVQQGHRIGYVPEAAVWHIHDENWAQIKRRFEREAIALQHIMPEIHVSFGDFLRYFASAVWLDSKVAFRRGVLLRSIREIVMYRLMQFWGAYRGNHAHRQVSKERKERYFYPT